MLSLLQLNRNRRRAAGLHAGPANSDGGAEVRAGREEQGRPGGAAAEPGSAERVLSERAVRPAAGQVCGASVCVAVSSSSVRLSPLMLTRHPQVHNPKVNPTLMSAVPSVTRAAIASVDDVSG